MVETDLRILGFLLNREPRLLVSELRSVDPLFCSPIVSREGFEEEGGFTRHSSRFTSKIVLWLGSVLTRERSLARH